MEITLAQFIDTFFVNHGYNFYSRYDVSEIGFALSDAGYYDENELKMSYNLFKSDRSKWLKEYAWSDDRWQQADMIDWLKPFIK